jgi:hypothetical protein
VNPGASMGVGLKKGLVLGSHAVEKERCQSSGSRLGRPVTVWP